MKKQVKFKNGFDAIFSGTLVQTYLSKDQIKHHKIINRKLVKKSDEEPFIVDGIDIINTSVEPSSTATMIPPLNLSVPSVLMSISVAAVST